MAHFRESGALHLEVLDQAPARNVPLEVDIFDGANPGTLLESLEGATDISYEELLNEVGAGKYLISVHDPKAIPEVVDREHLAKIKLGGVYRYAIWMEKRKIVSIGEGEEAEEHWSIGGREGTMAYLERAAWYHTSAAGYGAYIVDGRWRFVGVTAGLILKIALEEALARSPSPIEFLTYDFDEVSDSQGNAWTKTSTIDIEFGTSLLDTIRKLTAMGEMDVKGRHDLRLQAYVEMGRHLDAESIPNAVVFRAGQNVRTTLERTTSRPQVKSRMLVKGKGDLVFEVLRPDLEADPYIRRREGFLSFQDSSDPTTIQRAAEADLRGRLADQESITVGVTHGDGPGEYEPYTDYLRGDWITVDDPGVFDLATHRIVGMAISQYEATFNVDLTLNSIEYEALLKLARKTGAYGSGSSGGTSSAVSGGTSTGGTGGTDNRVAVETGDTPGLLYGKLQQGQGITLAIVGAAGSRKVEIATAIDLDALQAEIDAHEMIPHAGGNPQPGTGTYDATVLAHPDLIGYWPLNETSGLAFDDAVGVFNGTGASADQVFAGAGGAMTFDGRPCVYMSGGASSRITMGTGRTIPSPYTLEVWIKPNPQNIENVSILGKWNTTGTMIFLTQGKVQVHTTAQGTCFWPCGIPYLADGLWHHIVATYDGATARLYVDGVLRESKAYVVHANPATGQFEIGAYSNGGSSEYGGYVAAAALYDAPLTLAEVEDHYERGTGVSL